MDDRGIWILADMGLLIQFDLLNLAAVHVPSPWYYIHFIPINVLLPVLDGQGQLVI